MPAQVGIGCASRDRLCEEDLGPQRNIAYQFGEYEWPVSIESDTDRWVCTALIGRKHQLDEDHGTEYIISQQSGCAVRG